MKQKIRRPSRWRSNLWETLALVHLPNHLHQVMIPINHPKKPVVGRAKPKGGDAPCFSTRRNFGNKFRRPTTRELYVRHLTDTKHLILVVVEQLVRFLSG
jgi:hypothetical protein